MNTREEFGNYVLLKKLYDDTLGETLRAGKLGAQGLEQVVLLRVFNGSSIDADRLWQKLSMRGPVQEALKSPNIATGVDLGRVRNVPYVAYDYISGKNLASLLQQAVRESSPIPVDHALLIAERIALGLAVGYETRYDGQRILHGFLVPHLVMLANEGEIQVLGFEAGPGIREGVLSGAVPPDFARYLSPEALAGQPVSKQDDVFSLGVILFELLTGKALPAGATPAHIKGAVVASEGTALPVELSELIQRSLVPAGERISDVVTWHKSLSKLMIDGHYNPTTFNLAFFMHNLFRDDIEQESKEIEAERTRVVSAATTLIPAEQLRTSPAATALADEGTATDHGTSGAAAKGSKTGLIAALAAALVLVIAAVVYFVYFSGPKEQTAAPSPEVAQQEEPLDEGPVDPLANGEEPVEGEVEPAAGPDPEEIRAQIDQLISERTENLRAEYDDRIQELQRALDEAKEVPEDPPATVPREVAASPTAGADQSLAANLPAGSQPGTSPSTGTGGEAEAKTAVPPQKTGAVGQETGGAAKLPAGSATTEPVGKPEAAAKTEAARPEPVAERVRVGDLVTSGPGVVPPQKRSMPDPRYPPLARRLNKQATVEVRTLVNENGRVDRSELAGPDPGFGFGDAALAAARAARFDPATKNGVRVKMWYTLKIEFRP